MMDSENDADRRIRHVDLTFAGQENDSTKYLAIVIDSVFAERECQELIQLADDNGYEEALVNIGRERQQKMTDVRSSDRCIVDDPVLALNIWQRVSKILESASPNNDAWQKLNNMKKEWTPVGLNERLRFLKYNKGGYFRHHFDGCYTRGYEAGVDRSGEQSFVTCQVYLNEGFKGGKTRFLSQNNLNIYTDVIPKTGSVLLFQHNLLHEGCPVLEGQKFAIRTDVMYTQKGPGHEYSVKPIVLTKQQNSSNSFEEAMEA